MNRNNIRRVIYISSLSVIVSLRDDYRWKSDKVANYIIIDKVYLRCSLAGMAFAMDDHDDQSYPIYGKSKSAFELFLRHWNQWSTEYMHIWKGMKLTPFYARPLLDWILQHSPRTTWSVTRSSKDDDPAVSKKKLATVSKQKCSWRHKWRLKWHPKRCPKWRQ